MADLTTTGRPAPGHHPIAAQTAPRWDPSTGRGVPSKGGAGAVLEKRSTTIVRYLDVVLVAVAAPVTLALGTPVFGYAVGAGAWVLQRIIARLDRHWLSRAAEPRTQLAASLFEAFGRIWLLAGAIVIAGAAGGRADGLTAAVVIFGAYSIAFVIRVLSGPSQRKAVE
jgi:hypothetical protein